MKTLLFILFLNTPTGWDGSVLDLQTEKYCQQVAKAWNGEFIVPGMQMIVWCEAPQK